MKNLVGDKIPSQKQVDSFIERVEALSEELQEFTVSLSADQRKRTIKFRRGGEGVVSAVAVLADKHGLSLPATSTAGMASDLTLAQRLAPLAMAVSALQQRIDDTVLEAQGESWWAATAYYTVLSRMASGDPELQTALKPLIDFFAIGPRPKASKEEKADKPAKHDS